VTFHDGTPFSAEDVRFSFLAYRDDYDSALVGMFALITDVVVENSDRVTVTFAEPDGAFLFNAASQPIFSAAQYTVHWEQRSVGERSLSGFDWAATPPIGTGPWVSTGASEDELILRRNDAYWNEPPHFEELRLIAENDQDARIEGWKRGDVDVVSQVRVTDLDAVWDEEGTLFVAPSPTVFFAAFNFANPANATPDMMADPALRQALSLAVDREAYARDVFFTFMDETKAGTITQPWAHDDSIRNPEFDIDEANRILDEAGWADIDGDGMREDGFGNELDLYLIVSNQERPELLAIIDRLGADFAKIGAKLTVQTIEPGEFDTRWVENRMYDMVAFSLVEYPAFNHFDLYGTAWDIRSNSRGWNPGGYSNPVVDSAIDAYFQATSMGDMRAALSTLQQGANDDLFGLWFGFPHDLVLVREDIQGFVPNMFIQTYNTRAWWRGEGGVEGESPDETPEVATPVASPEIGTPESATPIASPVAFPRATPER
jgi:peptide/nickel transport system substrate-binding protein